MISYITWEKENEDMKYHDYMAGVAIVEVLVFFPFLTVPFL
jgi:hypothetical protein